jgi:hypothetical protein
MPTATMITLRLLVREGRPDSRRLGLQQTALLAPPTP